MSSFLSSLAAYTNASNAKKQSSEVSVGSVGSVGSSSHTEKEYHHPLHDVLMTKHNNSINDISDSISSNINRNIVNILAINCDS